MQTPGLSNKGGGESLPSIGDRLDNDSVYEVIYLLFIKHALRPICAISILRSCCLWIQKKVSCGMLAGY